MGSPAKAGRKLETWEAVTVAFIGAVFFSVMCSSILPMGRTHDFLALYTSGVIVKTDPTRLYDPDLGSQVEHALAPGIPMFSPLVRPAFSALFYVPLSWMPLAPAFNVWIGMGIAAALSIWYWAFRRFGPEALVYCAFFVPLGVGIAHGQDTAFVTALAILAYVAAERGRKVLCGLLLALLLAKFHLFLLVPLVLVKRREWRILAGYVSGALVAISVSVALASPQSYLKLLTDPRLEALSPSPEMMVNVHAIAVNFGLDFMLVKILLIVGVLVTVLSIPKDAPLTQWFWAAICGGLLIPAHTYGYDASLLLMPILGILTDATASLPRRWIAGIGVIPFPYFMTLLPKPFAAGPAILVVLLLFAIAWPEWFRRSVAPSSVPQTSVT